MDDSKLLRQLRRGNPQALEEAIAKYSAYVMAVIRNRSRGLLTPEDHEEIASDVFLALWRSGAQISPRSLRPWLGSVARNRTVDLMKKHRQSVPLEQQVIEIPDSAWAHLSQTEQARAVRQALSTLSPQDREIFLRHYDLAETSVQIAQAMDLNPATVRSRLSRGRTVLRNALIQGGYDIETED